MHFKKALELNPNYQDAKIKLDFIQKDEISRLARTDLEEETVESSTVTRDLRATIRFSTGDKRYSLPEEAVLQVKNVRTSKLMQKAINITQIESGNIDLDCSPLGLLASQDILLFQIYDVKSSNVIRFAPHYLEKDEIMANHCQVDLDLELNHSDEDIEKMTKYLLVHLSSKQMADLVGTGSSYRAILQNASNGLEAVGHLNPENEEQISFVLNASHKADDGVAAVKPGDKLSIKVQDSKNTCVFAMEFAVGKSDVKNFCKTIVPKDSN